MNLLNIVTAILASVNLMLAASVYIHSNRGKQEMFYTLTTLCASFWAITVLLLSSSIEFSHQVYLVIAVVHYITGYGAYLSFFWFVVYYQKRTVSLIPIIITTIIELAIMIIISIAPQLIFKSLNPAAVLGERIIFEQPGYGLMVAFGVFIYIYEMTMLVLKRNIIPVIEKKSHAFLSGGIVLTGFFGLFFDNILPWWTGDFSFFKWSPILTVAAFLGTGSYLILRFNFFNIKVIATELLTFSIWGFLLVKLFLSDNMSEFLVSGGLLVLVVIFGSLLIKSVLSEVNEREDLEKISSDLKDLKTNLELRVREQSEQVKTAYEVEKKARIDLEELDESKNKFILATQHHLRTPLTIIGGYLKLLQTKQLSEDITSIVNRMTKATNEISNSTNDLLRTTEIRSKNN